MSSFLHALRSAADPIAACLKFVLVWAAAADESVDDAEMALIAAAAPDRTGSPTAREILRFVEPRNLASDAGAFAIFRQTIKPEYRERFLELVIGIMTADGRMAHSEVHALRFLADLLEISPGRLNALYSSDAGKDLPTPPDISDPAWWDALEARRHSSESASSSTGSRSDDSKGAQPDSRRQAWAVLGLVEGASLDEIRTAYRRLASVHHPDRFAGMGTGAVHAATATFQRIQSAYETLSRGST